jgi:hypothetical protein
MFGPEIRDWIVGLDESGAVALVRSLLQAEANRLGLPQGAFRMTGIVKAKDRGVDGHSDFPAHGVTPLPTGPQTWQVKATQNKPDLAKELSKEGVIEDLHAGRNYVLAWTRDPPLKRAELEAELLDLVGRVVEGRTGLLFGTEDFERLANIHPAVIQALGGPQLLGLPLLGWAEHLRPNELPFAFDEERERLAEAIREFALSSDETPSHLHIFGDTGVGKSRLVFQSLSGEDLEGSVFVCPRADRVKTEPLEGFVNSEAVAILVVDDVSYPEAGSLATYAAGSRGRLRLITIGERSRRDATPGPATLEVPPLERGVVASLVSGVAGLTEEQASLVAGLAEGYPKLAVELANALAGADDTASVVQLLQTANVGALLERMIPTPTHADTSLTLLSLTDWVLTRALPSNPISFARYSI